MRQISCGIINAMWEKHKITIVIIGGAIVIVLLFVLLFWPGANNPPPKNSGSAAPAAASGSVPQSATSAPVPANIVVPNEGDKNVPQNVAVPQVQGTAAPSSNASYRQFSISADNNEFIPTTVIVKKGDTVDLEITAVDKNYDFTQPDYGLAVVLTKGKTQKIQFQATMSGKFTFYCVSCGSSAKGPVGYIVVTE